MAKLDVVGFGMIIGSVWGLSILVLAIMSRVSRKAQEAVQLFSKVYRGFGKTLSGSVIGAIWGFIDGAVSGFLFAWVYNKIVS